MKKWLNDIFSITRNERIGLISLIVIIGGILLFKALSPNDNGTPMLNEPIAKELMKSIKEAKTDTIEPKKRGKRKKSTNKTDESKSPQSISSLEEMNKIK